MPARWVGETFPRVRRNVIFTRSASSKADLAERRELALGLARQPRVLSAAWTRTNQGESNVRSYTSLALGCVFSLSVAACGSSSDDPSGSGPPEFGGPPPGAAGSNGTVPPVTAPVNTTPDPVVPASPPIPSSNEGGPDVSGLEPSTPPANEGGSQTPDENTNEEPTQPADPPPAEQPPVEEQPPAEEPQTARTRAFLLFGQSNMYGLPNPQAVDLEINPRVEVLTLQACGRHGVDQWMPAQPPLHGCVGQPSGNVFGPGLGPGDYFARTLAAAFPEDTILLVPNAIAGVSIDVFQPGQAAYNSLLARARIAQQRGEIAGFIFHQGESDCGSPQSRQSWPGRVRNVVDALRSDLGIGDAPFVAGEIIYQFDCAGDMNPVIGSLPNVITNAAVVSANGNFGAVQGDNFNNLHFDLAAQRELGRRYGEAMLGLLQP
jgi:carbohydrate esterase-like sialic acid-specific acetylesterase